MPTLSSQKDVQAQKHFYLQRVKQFYDDIQNWLKDENWVFVTQPTEIYEELGHYVVPFLSIKTAADELLAEMKPAGASVVMAEGLIEVVGRFDNDYVDYMLAGGPIIVEPSGIKRSIYQSVNVDGWYWDRFDAEPLLINNKNSLMQLMTWVNDYEFV
jgi:hypothetical protein